MTWFKQLWAWWRTERLYDAVLAMIERGTGVSEAQWAQGTPASEVLGWFDDQVAAQRTPYGVMGAKVVLVQHQRLVLDQLVTQADPWWGQHRDIMATTLPDLLAAGPVVSGVVAVGTATHAVIERS